MTREQKYIEQMQRLGIYDDIFEPEVHSLFIMERDLQRLTKRWKEEGYRTVEKNGRGPATTDKNFDAIMVLRRQILSMKDALGVTPRALARLIGRPTSETPDDDGVKVPELTILDEVRSKYA